MIRSNDLEDEVLNPRTDELLYLVDTLFRSATYAEIHHGLVGDMLAIFCE